MRERDVIKRLRDAFGEWGIGDDAAVLAPPDGELLFASDAVVEGVHFRRGCGTLGQAVQKVITSNVSDIYAMGGVPRAIVMTAGLPSGCGESEIESIIWGATLACEVYGVKLAGGDTVRSPGGCFFDVSIVGSVERGRAVRRSGARPGDAIVVFGKCGGSWAGLLLLHALLDGKESASLKAAMEITALLSLAMEEDDIMSLCDEHGVGREMEPVIELAARHLVPRARPLDRTLLAARAISAGAPSIDTSLPADHPGGTGVPCVAAMIDVSDGLARDLRALCAESGVGASIEEALLPVHPALERLTGPSGTEQREGNESLFMAASIPDTTELVLSSGEEYVLLAAVRGLAEGAEFPGGTVIGSIVGRRQGLTIVTRDGERRPLPELGYEHLF